MTIAAGVSAIGSILGGIGGFKAARGKAKALEAGAAQARAEAGVNAQLALEEADRAAGSAAVDAAAGGGLTGSALGALDDLTAGGMYNARTALYAGTVEGRNLQHEATVSRRQGGLTLITGWLNAAGAASTALGSMQNTRQARLAASQQRGLSRAQSVGFDLKGAY
ncbi:hypothetical protein [Caulobacter sp. X]|uniref:hypothetical protein n=1 Tax=Caulobacter sp. X TaxID=2048901 RepID=UPI000C1474FA|nr:hypothetical protein [Caulobacter sp. X]PIB96515.1 hypothetical protein CSW60_18580 [Caulobacter sp. X]